MLLAIHQSTTLTAHVTLCYHQVLLTHQISVESSLTSSRRPHTQKAWAAHRNSIFGQTATELPSELHPLHHHSGEKEVEFHRTITHCIKHKHYRTNTQQRQMTSAAIYHHLLLQVWVTFMTRKGRKAAASKSLILYFPLMRRAKREERNSRHFRFTVVFVSQNL